MNTIEHQQGNTSRKEMAPTREVEAQSENNESASLQVSHASQPVAATTDNEAVPVPTIDEIYNNRALAFTELVAYTRQREEQLASLNLRAHEESFLLDARSMLAGFTLEQIETKLLPAWKALEAKPQFKRGLSLEAYLRTVGAIAEERYPKVNKTVLKSMLSDVFTKMDASCSGFVNWNVFVMYLIDTADDVAMSADALKKGVAGATAAGSAGRGTGVATSSSFKRRSTSPVQGSDEDAAEGVDEQEQQSPTQRKKKKDQNDFLRHFGIRSHGTVAGEESGDDDNHDPKDRKKSRRSEAASEKKGSGSSAVDTVAASRNTLVLMPDEDRTNCINMCGGPLDFVGSMLCLDPLAYLALITRMGVLHIVESTTFKVVNSVKFGGHCCASTFVHDRSLDQSVPGLFAVTTFLAITTQSFKLHIFPGTQFKLRATINTPELVNSLAFSYGDLYLYGGTRTGNVLCWVISPKGIPCLVRSIALHNDAINDMLFLSRGDMTLVTASSDTYVMEYSLSREQWVLDDAVKRSSEVGARKSGAAETTILRNSAVSQAAAAAEKALAAGSKSAAVETGKAQGHASTGTVTLGNNNEVAKLTTDSVINITNSSMREIEVIVPTHSHVKKFKGHLHAVLAVVFAPPQKLLITNGGDGSILCFVQGFPTVPAYHIMDLANPHSGLIVHCSVDPSGLFLTTFDNANLGKVWDLRTMRATDSKTVVAHSRSKTVHAISSTHQRSSNTIFVNTNSHCHVYRLENPKDAVAGCIFEDSFDSLVLLAPHPAVPSSIVAVNLSTVVVWDVVQLKRLAVHDDVWGTISSAALDRHGNSFVAGSTFGELGVFRLDTGRLIRQYEMPENCGEISVVQYAVTSGQIIAVTDRRHVVFCPDHGENEFGSVPVLRVVPSIVKISRLVSCPEAGVYLACDQRQECRSLLYNTMECVLRIRNIRRRDNFLLNNKTGANDDAELSHKRQERLEEAQKTTNETERATRLQERIAHKKFQQLRRRTKGLHNDQLNIKIPALEDLPRTLLDDDAECVNICSLAPYPACVVSSTDGCLQLVCLKPHILADEVICRWENKADLVNVGASVSSQLAKKASSRKDMNKQNSNDKSPEKQSSPSRTSSMSAFHPTQQRGSNLKSIMSRPVTDGNGDGGAKDDAGSVALASVTDKALFMSIMSEKLEDLPMSASAVREHVRRRGRKASITYVPSVDGGEVDPTIFHEVPDLENNNPKPRSQSVSPATTFASPAAGNIKAVARNLLGALEEGSTSGSEAKQQRNSSPNTGGKPPLTTPKSPDIFADVGPLMSCEEVALPVAFGNRRNSLASAAGDDGDEEEQSHHKKSKEKSVSVFESPLQHGTTNQQSSTATSASFRTPRDKRRGTTFTPQLVTMKAKEKEAEEKRRKQQQRSRAAVQPEEDDDDRLPPVVLHMHFLHPYTLICVDDRQRIVIYDLSDIVLQSRLFDATTKMAPSLGNNVLITSGASSPAQPGLNAVGVGDSVTGGSTNKQAILYFHKVLRPPIVRVVNQFTTPSQVNAMVFIKPCYIACLDDKSRPTYFSMIANEITQISALPASVSKSRKLQRSFDEIRRDKFAAPKVVVGSPRSSGSPSPKRGGSPSSPRSPQRSRRPPMSPTSLFRTNSNAGSSPTRLTSPPGSPHSTTTGEESPNSTGKSRYHRLWKKYTNLFRVLWLLTKFLGVSKAREKVKKENLGDRSDSDDEATDGKNGVRTFKNIKAVAAKRKAPVLDNDDQHVGSAQDFPFVTDRACLVGLAAGDDAPNFMCLSFDWCHNLANIAIDGEDGDGSRFGSYMFGGRGRGGAHSHGTAGHGGINFHCRHNVLGGRVEASVNYTNEVAIAAEQQSKRQRLAELVQPDRLTAEERQDGKVGAHSVAVKNENMVKAVTPSVNLDRTQTQYIMYTAAKNAAAEHQRNTAKLAKRHMQRTAVITASGGGKHSRRRHSIATSSDEDEEDFNATTGSQQPASLQTKSVAKKKKKLNPQARHAAEEAERQTNHVMKHALLLAKHDATLGSIPETRIVDRSPSRSGSSRGTSPVRTSGTPSRVGSPFRGGGGRTTPHGSAPLSPCSREMIEKLTSHGEKLASQREQRQGGGGDPLSVSQQPYDSSIDNELSLLALLDSHEAQQKGRSPPPLPDEYEQEKLLEGGEAEDDEEVGVDARFFFEDRDEIFQAKKQRMAKDSVAMAAKSKKGIRVPTELLMKQYGAGGATMANSPQKLAQAKRAIPSSAPGERTIADSHKRSIPASSLATMIPLEDTSITTAAPSSTVTTMSGQQDPRSFTSSSVTRPKTSKLAERQPASFSSVSSSKVDVKAQEQRRPSSASLSRYAASPARNKKKLHSVSCGSTPSKLEQALQASMELSQDMSTPSAKGPATHVDKNDGNVFMSFTSGPKQHTFAPGEAVTLGRRTDRQRGAPILQQEQVEHAVNKTTVSMQRAKIHRNLRSSIW